MGRCSPPSFFTSCELNPALALLREADAAEPVEAAQEWLVDLAPAWAWSISPITIDLSASNGSPVSCSFLSFELVAQTLPSSWSQTMSWMSCLCSSQEASTLAPRRKSSLDVPDHH